MTMHPPGPKQVPHGDGRAAGQRRPPPSALAAVKLMYLAAGLALLGLLFDLVAHQEIRDRIADRERGRPPDEIATAADVTIGSLVIAGLLSFGLWLWMAQTTRRGLSWARIVATVLVGVVVAFTLYSAPQTTSLGVVIKLVLIGLGGAVLFLLYRPDSNAFYRSRPEQLAER